MSSRFNNLVGTLFGRLEVIGYLGNKKWKCLCSCGNLTVVYGYNLTGGKTKSCGCLKIEKQTIHGKWKSSEYRAFQDMHQRCNNPNNAYYLDYGGRGITVCERWDDFQTFIHDMGEKPSSKHSLDRIDNDKGYSPDNCRWATIKEQNSNRRCRKLNRTK